MAAEVGDSRHILESSATKLCELLRLGELTSVAVLEAFIAKVEADPLTNAVVVKDYGAARTRAARADECWRCSGGRSLWGRLHGLPMTVKEEVQVQGLCSHRADGDGEMDLNNCVAVQRLLDEGAIIFGKTNTPSRCRDWQTYNETFGPTVNPHDPQRSCGGSSGGSCVAVAQQHSPVELGADVAGSIRVPACYCGVFGMQGTYGRIPTTTWCIPHSNDHPATDLEALEAPVIDASTAHLTVAPHGLKVIGPICKYPEDLALMNAVLERAAPMTSLPKVPSVGVDSVDHSPMFRVALLSEISTGTGSPEPALSGTILDALDRVRRQLSKAEAEEPLEPLEPLSRSCKSCGISVVTLRKLFPANFAEVSYDLYHQILANRDRATDPKVMASRSWCRMVWNAFFDANAIDAVLMPISPTLPFLRNELLGADAYTPERKVWVNDSSAHPPEQRCYADYFYWPHFSILAQLPSVSIPCGLLELPQVQSPCEAFTPASCLEHPASKVGEPRLCKVPVGFQLVGRPHADAQLVDMAAEMHRILGAA